MIEILEQIGLSRREATLYSALVETGRTTTGPLVKKTGIPASKIYGVLERLVRKGLVSVITRQKTKHFSATNPERLLEYVGEKRKELEERENEVKKLLPYLKERRKEGEEMQGAEVAYGFEGLKGLLYKMLSGAKKGDEWLFFSFTVQEPQRYQKVYDFYRKFDKPRREAGLKIKGILPMHVKKAAGRRDANMCYVDFPVPTNITICGDRVLFTPWEHEEVAYLIYSRHLADSLRGYFYSVFNRKKGK